MPALGNRLVLSIVALAAAIVLLAPSSANAAGTPDIGLEKTQPEHALLGTQQEVTLRASNPKEQERGYNLTFRDVLPKGVDYVGPAHGSDGSALEPQIIEDAPNEGETTLIFENVADLSANSHYSLTFKVEATSPEYTVGQSYTDEAEAFVNEDARVLPKFDAEGRPEATSFTGSSEAEATTTLTAVEIKKTEPSAEQELLRGIHEHQTVYTLKLINNEVGPTKELAVDDYLPAGLEFLGCGETDNTEEAPTNLGSKEEYPGSGEIFPGNHPTAEKCREPNSVETEEVDPPGTQPKGIYTHVRWTGLGELKPGEELEFQYRAAIPIRENTLNWPHGEPTAASLGQAANLDNNSGKETFDEEPLVNVSQVSGRYEGTATEDTDEWKAIAEDLAVQKSVDKPTIGAGQLSEWTFRIETSEYRYSNDIQIEDVLPNGLCPLGEEPNYEGPVIGSPIEPEPECENKGGELPSSEYTSVEEQENGSFIIRWNEETVEQLKQMAPSTVFEITFPTHTRVDYQKEFKSEKPVLTGDHWTNKVEIEAPSFARCTPKAQDTCEGGGTHISAERAEEETILDASAAEQKAGGVSIDKTVRENIGAVPTNCEGTYVQGLESPFPLYGPGDQICWKLRVKFNANLFSGEPVVTDFLPPEQRYVESSIIEGPENSVVATPETGEASGGVLKWTINGGKAVESEKVFEFLFKTEMLTSATAFPKDITGNLMKFSYSNTEGETFPLRDQAEVERQEPNIALAKGVTEVNELGVVGAPATGVTVHGGDEVKYELDLTNTGNLAAQGTEVWDVLPEGMTCTATEIKEISGGGTCEGEKIVWKNIAVPTGGAKVPLTYVATVPADYAPAHSFVNKAGVTQYKTPTDTGGEFEYIPAENIDPAAGEANTKPILAEAEINTKAAGLKKEATTETTQGGNANAQATIGEIIDYKVEATIPADSKIYGTPVLTDNLPANLEFITGSATAKLDGATLPSEGATLEELANGAAVHFSGPYPTVVENKEHALVLTLKARVLNHAVNVRGTSIANKTSFEFEDKAEAGAITKREAEVKTTVVEPNIKTTKRLLPAGRSQTVSAGEVVEYEVKATDQAGTNVSTANEVLLEDTIPTGMEVVDAAGGTVAGGKITWQVGAIEPGASVSRVYKLKVKEPATAASVFRNEVTGETQSLPDEGGVPPTGTRVAGFEEGAYKASASGYEAKAEETVRLVGATVSKEVTPGTGTIGTELTYTLHMHLPPGITFYDATMVDTLPNGIEFDELVSAECVEGCTGTIEGEELPPRGGEGATTLLGWYFGSFAAGEARELKVVFKGHLEDEKTGGGEVKAGETLTNSVVGLYDETEVGKPTEVPTPGPGKNGFSEETNTAQANTEVVEPELTIEKSVTGNPALSGGTIAQPGTTLSYTLKVKNTGTSNAYDFDVEDTPGAHLTEITPGPVGPGITAPTGEPLVWHVEGPLAPGAEIELTYTAKLAPSTSLETGDQIENLVEVPVYFGLTPAEQATAKAKREYPPIDAEKSVQVELPQITLEKTSGLPGHADGEKVDVNEAFPWRIVVGNAAEHADAKEAVVRDELPKNWTYVAGSATVGGTAVEPSIGVGNPQVLTWTLPALNAGTSTEIVFEAKPGTAAVSEPGLAAEANVNGATVHAKDLSGAEESEEGPYEAGDVANATLVAPQFTVTKTPDGGTAVAGEEAEYSIEVKNIGGGEASEPIEVEDVLSADQEFVEGAVLPAGVTQNSVTHDSPAAGQTTVVWEIVSLPATVGTVTIPVPIKVPSTEAAGTEIKDHASASSPQDPTSAEDEGSFTVQREADLAIQKEADRANINGGEEINYKLTAENLGPSEATGVTVTDEIPAGTTFLKAEPEANCSFAAGKVTCLAGSLAVNAKAEFHVIVEVEPGRVTPIFNTAKVEGNEPDPVPSNNEKTIETPIGGSADLSIVKTGPTQPVLLGSTFTYKLEVKNEGPSDATNVDVVDPLPAEVEFLEATAPAGTSCTEAAGTLTCELGTFLRKATPVVIEVTVKAIGLPAGGEAVNTAEVESSTPDPEPDNNESTAETEILPAADLAITKTAPASVEPNGELTYELHVEDLGPSTAHQVVVNDPLPAGVDFVEASEGCAAAAGVVTCKVQPADELELGAAADFQVTVHVPFALGGQALVNTAAVSGEEGDPHSENNSSTVTTNVGPAADLSITKTMGKAQAGQPLTYTLAITNHGPSGSSAVTVTDTLPAGTSFRSAAPSQGTCSVSGQTVSCMLGPLAAGGSAQVSITVDVATTTTGTLRNKAGVEGPEPDPDKSNNEASVEGPVDPAPPRAPNLRVVKTVETSTPRVGTPFDYHLAISNLSGAEAKNVKVVDTLNGPVDVVSIDPESGHCSSAGSKITCTIPSIPVGKTVHVTYSVIAQSAGRLRNTASVEAANGEKLPSDNHAVKSVKAKAAAPANFKLTKTASRKLVRGGKKVGFAITLRNGADALVDATVCDRLPAALVFVKAPGARYVDGEACWTKKFVAAHKVLHLHLVARAVKGYKSRRVRNLATARADNATQRSAAARVRIKPAFGGRPGGVTG